MLFPFWIFAFAWELSLLVEKNWGHRVLLLEEVCSAHMLTRRSTTEHENGKHFSNALLYSHSLTWHMEANMLIKITDIYSFLTRTQMRIASPPPTGICRERELTLRNN